MNFLILALFFFDVTLVQKWVVAAQEIITNKSVKFRIFIIFFLNLRMLFCGSTNFVKQPNLIYKLEFGITETDFIIIFTYF